MSHGLAPLPAVSEIRVLGSGGFNNRGLPFISFLIDDSVLVETPPDIIQSLRREGASLSALRTVIISHFHGDHCFGLPFLVFNLYRENPAGLSRKLLLAGPRGIRERALELMALAINPTSSYIGWFERNVEIREITRDSEIGLDRGRSMKFHPVLHRPENYALSLWSGASRPDFLYISDTKWGPQIAALFALGAKLVFCDANGSPGDEDVHMSAAQISGLGLPLARGLSRIAASHVSGDAPEAFGGLSVISAGDVFRV